DCRLHDELARGVERERVGRHKGLQYPEQSAGKSSISRGDNKSGELVAMNVMADGRGPQRIVADRAQDCADRRTYDAQTNHNPQEVPERHEGVERPIAVELDGRKTQI